jgi:hypothetical protein
MEKSLSEGGNLKLGANRFADQLPQEMQRILNYIPPPPTLAKASNSSNVGNLKNIPASFDWRVFGMVSPIKD